MRKRRLGKDEKREVTPEFVNMSKEILYPQIQGVTDMPGIPRDVTKHSLDIRVRETAPAPL
jgi:hypothetical protein